MKVPTIIFKNFMLRDVKLEDYKDMYEYGSDLRVCKTLNWGPYNDILDAKYAIKNIFLKRPADGLPIGYAIVDLDNNKMIGTIDFHTKTSNGAEIGYCLNYNYHNRGIMSAALGQLIKIGFNILGYDFIIVGHVIDNLASKKVITNNNFKFDKISDKGFYDRFENIYKPVYWYKLTKEDYYHDK